MFQKLKQVGAAIGAMAATGAVMAQETGGATGAFTTAVTSATTNIGTFGAALVGLAAVGVAFMIGVKYVKKIRGAA